jgi:hypothetical protein
MWSRYTSSITGALAEGIQRALAEHRDHSEELIGSIIDRMAQLQSSNPAFIEIWSCVAASMELRALNIEDTLHNARSIADFLRKMHPKAAPTTLLDRALVAIEMSSSTTRLALCLPEPHRARILQSLKSAIALLLNPASLDGVSPAPRQKRRSAGIKKAAKRVPSKRAATAKAGPSSR